MTTVFHAWACGRFTEHTATLGERNFIERMKTLIFFEQAFSSSPNPM